MKDEVILQKYTRALFEVAEEQGLLKKVESDLARIDQTFKNLPQLVKFITSPQVEWKQKIEITKTLVKGLSQYIVNFVQLVMEKERQFILPKVPGEFHRILELREKRAKAVLTTAVPIDEDVKKLLRKKLSGLFEGKISFEDRIDPEVIGGLKVQVGYTVIDGTIKRKLEELGRALAKG